MEDANSTKLKNLLLSLASTRLQPTGYRVANVAGDGDCKGLVFLELHPCKNYSLKHSQRLAVCRLEHLLHSFRMVKSLCL
jgi:hypothetical protein